MWYDRMTHLQASVQAGHKRTPLSLAFSCSVGLHSSPGSAGTMIWLAVAILTAGEPRPLSPARELGHLLPEAGACRLPRTSSGSGRKQRSLRPELLGSGLVGPKVGRVVTNLCSV